MPTCVVTGPPSTVRAPVPKGLTPVVPDACKVLPLLTVTVPVRKELELVTPTVPVPLAKANAFTAGTPISRGVAVDTTAPLVRALAVLIERTLRAALLP